MKKFRNCLVGMLVLLCLFGSCSGGTDPGGSTPLEEEGIGEKVKDTDKDEDGKNNDNTGEDDTENTEDPSEEIPPAPIFLYCKVVSQKKIVFGFSQPVAMKDLSFSTEQEQEILLEYEKSGKGKTITVNLAENLQSGQVLIANFIAEDDYDHEVDKKVFFFSTATSVPALQINELRTENSSASFKAEFIEFKMLSDGNMGGLQVYVASNDKASLIYTFESVEVKEGEYVVLHLRTYENTYKDEYGDNLSESGGTDSCPTARDFWISSNELLRKTDAVYVMKDDWVLDAVMFADNPNAWSGKDYFTKTANLLFNKYAWKSLAETVSGVEDAVNSSNTTVTQTICRDETVENTHTKADWYITAKSCATPGKENNPKRL